jgi:hypothetical protein
VCRDVCMYVYAIGEYVAATCYGTSRLDIKVRLIHVCRFVCMYMQCSVMGLLDSMSLR